MSPFAREAHPRIHYASENIQSQTQNMTQNAVDEHCVQPTRSKERKPLNLKFCANRCKGAGRSSMAAQRRAKRLKNLTAKLPSLYLKADREFQRLPYLPTPSLVNSEIAKKRLPSQYYTCLIYQVVRVFIVPRRYLSVLYRRL